LLQEQIKILVEAENLLFFILGRIAVPIGRDRGQPAFERQACRKCYTCSTERTATGLLEMFDSLAALEVGLLVKNLPKLLACTLLNHPYFKTIRSDNVNL
jgi:hypothetical protein